MPQSIIELLIDKSKMNAMKILISSKVLKEPKRIFNPTGMNKKSKLLFLKAKIAFRYN